MESFELIEDDYFAIKIAMNAVRKFLMHEKITPEQIVGLGHALYALENLPKVTNCAYTEFGITYRKGNDDFENMNYIKFIISDALFEISIGGSTYEKSVGSDSYSEPGWSIDIDGYREAEGNLNYLEDNIEEFLNLGCEINVYDESEIEFD